MRQNFSQDNIHYSYFIFLHVNRQTFSNMNHIGFIIETHSDELGNDCQTIDFLIDKRPLKEIIKEHELPMAQAEGNPEIAGQYAPMGLPSPPVLKRHFLGKEKYWCGSGNKTVLFECGECGTFGCWPLLCEISVEENRVVWTKFEQP